MEIHHTKNKGDLGVLKAQCDLYNKGWIPCVPLTEHSSFDLLIVKGNEKRSVQVKARSINKNGSLYVKFKSSWSDSNGVHEKDWNRSLIDIVCIYCIDNDKCYYIKLSDFKNGSITLRVNTPKNNQLKNIIFAKDYTGVP